MREIKLQDLKTQTPAELVAFAEEKGVENASTMRKQEWLEGIVSKRTDARYRSGPSKTWLKSKNPASEAVRREREEEWR
jgi:ATP-dependent DNA ligase